MKNYKITSIHSVWIAYANKAMECWAVASKDNGYLVGRMFDGRWSIQYRYTTLVKAEDSIRMTLQAEGLSRLQCAGSLETALISLALNESWVSFGDIVAA